MKQITQPSSETLQLARGIRQRLAGSNLPRSLARLYSHSTLLLARQTGLPSWQQNETSERLHDAMLLLEAATVERAVEGDLWQDANTWRESMRRAAEILEWLSPAALNPDNRPIRLLATAAYQLAGYPARSSSLLRVRGDEEQAESTLLRYLLNAEFSHLQDQLTAYWAQSLLEHLPEEKGFSWADSKRLTEQVQQTVVKETAAALGVLCAFMRWGDEDRLEKAVDKLTAVADVFLHGQDTYSWILAKLCAEVVAVYHQSAMRRDGEKLARTMSTSGKAVMERYLRQNYLQHKSLAWPSQVRGIERLIEGQSFALCTPTGSGKTTVAELAILYRLFTASSPQQEGDETNAAPLALYLVPTRALAAEVEAKLDRVLRNLHDPPITVTGLYGGTDWGPTDAWLTLQNPTVLICTYEKAEALIRFQGPLFLRRVWLVVMDEVHLIQFNGQVDELRRAESRSLTLESLGARMLTYLDPSKSRVIALSAVASGLENALAGWVTGQPGASPAKTLYRSTRQLIGRLECQTNRGFTIYYDTMDGADLQFAPGGQSDETPYIRNPFPPCPRATAWERGGETRLRPFLLWAALHLAFQYYANQQGAVLVSVPQRITWMAKDFLTLLESTWAQENIPTFFQPPLEAEKEQLWARCLRSCKDYFGPSSYEYRLLEKGIVVHHGKMPGLMARLLVEVVQQRIVHFVLATSTLSEGVNLPIETILLSSVLRGGSRMSAREFNNLAGRAGRPGYGTEGRCLVLLEESTDSAAQSARRRYNDLLGDLRSQSEQEGNVEASSPLAALLRNLFNRWTQISSSQRIEDFYSWLEQSSPLQRHTPFSEDQPLPAFEMLDTLDSILLAVLAELEETEEGSLSETALEERLRQVWQRSFAHYADAQEATWGEMFVRRGRAMKQRIYTDPMRRRRLYRAGLPPRSADQLLGIYPEMKEHLLTGADYIYWNPEQRLAYIQKIVALLGTLPKFALEEIRGANWSDVLRWWLNPHAPNTPQPATPEKISEWFDYASAHFIYKLNWGLGSIIALVGDEVYGGKLLEPSLENWPNLKLPWIVFWLKELITWGTLEPVAAYMLARKIKDTRQDAEEAAKDYQREKGEGDLFSLLSDELLNPAGIRAWVEAYAGLEPSKLERWRPNQLSVDLVRDFSNRARRVWRVLPVEVDNRLYWVDPAGFHLATCPRPDRWEGRYLQVFDFQLDVDKKVVSSSFYV